MQQREVELFSPDNRTCLSPELFFRDRDEEASIPERV